MDEISWLSTLTCLRSLSLSSWGLPTAFCSSTSWSRFSSRSWYCSYRRTEIKQLHLITWLFWTLLVPGFSRWALPHWNKFKWSFQINNTYNHVSVSIGHSIYVELIYQIMYNTLKGRVLSFLSNIHKLERILPIVFNFFRLKALEPSHTLFTSSDEQLPFCNSLNSISNTDH